MVRNENFVIAYSTMNATEARLVQFLLENNGIETVIDNDEINFFFGIVAAKDALIDIWVPREKSSKAADLIAERSSIDTSALQFTPCKKCGQVNCGLFDYCWNCQADLKTGEAGPTAGLEQDIVAGGKSAGRRRTLALVLFIAAAIIAYLLLYVYRG